MANALRRIRCFAFLLLGMIAGPQGVLAQSAPEPPKMRFLFLDESAGHYTAQTSVGLRRVSDGPYEISAPFAPPNFKSFDLYKHLSDPETGKLAPVKVATIDVPRAMGSVLAIVSPRPASEPGAAPVYGVEIIDCDASKFPAGSIRVINRAQNPMAAQFGAERVVVEPGEDALVQPIPDDRYRVPSRVATRIESNWKVITSQTTLLLPDQRLFGIFIHSPSGMRHTYTAVELSELGAPPPGDFWLTFSDNL